MMLLLAVVLIVSSLAGLALARAIMSALLRSDEEED
jgi:hypothetical protein